MITSKLFEAYLSCRMKCWLLSEATEEYGNPIATRIEERNDAHRSKGIRSVEDEDADRLGVAGDLQANMHDFLSRMASLAKRAIAGNHSTR